MSAQAFGLAMLVAGWSGYLNHSWGFVVLGATGAMVAFWGIEL